MAKSVSLDFLRAPYLDLIAEAFDYLFFRHFRLFGILVKARC